MTWIALRMLTGDRSKYLGLVFGVMFATLLMTQQVPLVDIEERDIARFRRGAPAKAYPRGETAHEMTIRFMRVEPFVVPKKALTGENTERVDTRVLQVLYAIERSEHPVYVGQQLDVFIDGSNAVSDAPLTLPSPPSDGGEGRVRGRPVEGK